MNEISNNEILGLSLERMREERKILEEQEKLRNQELIDKQNERLLISKILQDYEKNAKLLCAVIE